MVAHSAANLASVRGTLLAQDALQSQSQSQGTGHLGALQQGAFSVTATQAAPSLCGPRKNLLCCELFRPRRASCGKSARDVLWEPEAGNRLWRPGLRLRNHPRPPVQEARPRLPSGGQGGRPLAQRYLTRQVQCQNLIIEANIIRAAYRHGVEAAAVLG